MWQLIAPLYIYNAQLYTKDMTQRQSFIEFSLREVEQRIQDDEAI